MRVGHHLMQNEVETGSLQGLPKEMDVHGSHRCVEVFGGKPHVDGFIWQALELQMTSNKEKKADEPA